ncbi:MAG TPA: prolipoprotein diacylglyceryl transferase family protein [Candidatus Eisenbacteria bacterium]|nr:prolipoprotein diacylglyceryl transferase family protein [Candidatus Eisenbacteria bacterium]
MTFPVVFHFGSLAVPAHLVFESLGYLLGFRTYLALRRRSHDDIDEGVRWTAIAAAAVGAAIGSKVLGWLDHPAEAWAHRGDFAWLLGGKTIVGGLLGGLIAVEIAKRAVGETRSTGDLFVIPLCVGMAIGRIGCFLAGLDDHTYGVATTLPWGVDFGDGVRRHPVQLYEIVVLGAIAAWSWRARWRVQRSGDVFRGFMILYLGFRLLVDGIKPESRAYFGLLSGIQVACLVGLLYYARDLPRIFLRWRGERHG